MPTRGRLRRELVPTRTALRLQRPHPGDRLTIMHRARSGPSTSANGSMANTTSRGRHDDTTRIGTDNHHSRRREAP